MNARVTSTAVMARRADPADSLDFFPTPPWATRAFCTHVLPAIVAPDDPVGLHSAWDPAAGEGHMALALADYFREVHASDIFADGYGFGRKADFLHPDFLWRPADWIVTNPPFNQGADFVFKALELCRVGVAMLVRVQFLEGQDRHATLFRRRPPLKIAQFVERVPMHRGRWVCNGKTATAYAWLVWLKYPPHAAIGADPGFMWIPRCRRALTKHDDVLNFRGCVDVPKKHRAAILLAGMAKKKPASLAEIRANIEARQPATLADIRRALEGTLA